MNLGSYVRTALANECQRVINAQIGDRNNQLNRAAFALGTLVGAGQLDEGIVWNDLTNVALQVGLTPEETRFTIRSGLSAGIQKPRKS